MWIRACSLMGLVMLSACVTIPWSMERTGPPIKLSTGAPTSECERRDWVEIVPVRARAGAPEDEIERDGVALFMLSGDKPMYVGEPYRMNYRVFLQMYERNAVRPWKQFREREEIALPFQGAGFAVTGLGLLFMTRPFWPDIDPAERDLRFERQGFTLAIGGGMLGLGALFLTIGFLLQPSTEELVGARLRTRAFLTGEDDLEKLQRDITSYHERLRVHCAKKAAP